MDKETLEPSVVLWLPEFVMVMGLPMVQVKSWPLSVKVLVHPEKDSLEAIATLLRSSRSVRT